MTIFTALLQQEITKTLLNRTQRQQTADYLALLARWNQHYNLTAIREPQRMVTHHILDSLSLLPWIKGQRIIDIGCGAGLPGIPLAIALPHKQIFLLDSNQKKTTFCQQVVADLKLENITVIGERAENWQPQQLFDHVITRAFSQINVMLRLSQHLCCAQGDFLAMKGEVTETELAQLPAEFSYSLHTLNVQGIAAKRTLVRIVKQHLNQGGEQTNG
ncbi:MAG: 16S rRNA (guanine(527)-N(7))-methyltransferase RsmG [Gammaproteobacteria bacterium]|nr:16S rRNA (guanine(527)-N(7))-methyltransferase RsmG [Gammaproteobacteria bacterium]